MSLLKQDSQGRDSLSHRAQKSEWMRRLGNHQTLKRVYTRDFQVLRHLSRGSFYRSAFKGLDLLKEHQPLHIRGDVRSWEQAEHAMSAPAGPRQCLFCLPANLPQSRGSMLLSFLTTKSNEHQPVWLQGSNHWRNPWHSCWLHFVGVHQMPPAWFAREACCTPARSRALLGL